MRFGKRFGRLAAGLALSVSAVGISAPASAAVLIDVQFQSVNAQTGAAVIGSAGDKWNMVAPRTTTGGGGAVSGTVNLLTSANTQSGIFLTYSAQAGVVGTNYAFSSTPYANLMQGYLAALGTPISLTLSGFNPGQQFDLYVYTQGDYATNGRRNDVTVNGVAQSSTNTNASSFILGNNYLRFQGAVNAGGKIVITDARGIDEANLNGFQLSFTPVPEPKSWAMLISGFVLVGAALRRRRTSGRASSCASALFRN